MKKRFQTKELPMIAKELLQQVQKAQTDTSVVLALSGELGAGKTTLTQEIGRQLGVKENLISPTFVIMKSYVTTDSVFKKLVHIDAYRLNSSHELLHLGWEELLKEKSTLIILEWPERVPECLREVNTQTIKLVHIDENTREIES